MEVGWQHNKKSCGYLINGFHGANTNTDTYGTWEPSILMQSSKSTDLALEQVVALEQVQPTDGCDDHVLQLGQPGSATALPERLRRSYSCLKTLYAYDSVIV